MLKNITGCLLKLNKPDEAKDLCDTLLMQVHASRFCTGLLILRIRTRANKNIHWCATLIFSGLQNSVDIKALFRRSQAHEALGNMAAAFTDMARVVELDPANVEVTPRSFLFFLFFPNYTYSNFNPAFESLRTITLIILSFRPLSMLCA